MESRNGIDFPPPINHPEYYYGFIGVAIAWQVAFIINTMEFQLDDAIRILDRTPAVLRAILNGLTPDWISNNEGEETWSPYDVIGHLLHGERTDWIPRARIILEEGEERPFEPFDRQAQFDEGNARTIDELLKSFEELRNKNIETLKEMDLREEDLERRGKHPELGIVTLKELLATWVAHDLSHIVQITRTMARQYKSEVGPWKAYLSVMK